jgi:tRNA nucleotidyltransferase/poly(A) polymerase
MAHLLDDHRSQENSSNQTLSPDSNIDLTDVFPEQAVLLLDVLELDGYEAYFVGGAVRDAIRGEKVSDIDIATTATPKQMSRCLHAYNLIPLGRRYGTMRAVLEDLKVDITTYRVESGYADHRRPDVSFVGSIDVDLSRRDFTMNAIAYHPTRGVYDPFDGIDAIRRREIVAVGTAKERLEEDYLRAMRALRFSASLCFQLETELAEVIKNSAAFLNSLPIERMGLEWSSLIPGLCASRVFSSFSDVLMAVLSPGPNACFSQAIRALEMINAGDPLRFPAFSLALNLPLDWFNALRLEKGLRKRLNKVITAARDPYLAEPVDDEVVWRQAFARYGETTIFDYIRIACALADDLREDDWFQLNEKLLIWSKSGVKSLADLAVDGYDLRTCIQPVQIGEALNRLFEEVAAGRLENERSLLCETAVIWYNT